jgi:hypothetical protein
VTLDYACQYTRATRTATLTNAMFDPVSGEVQLGLGGRADLQLQLQVYLGDGNSISNLFVPVPAFTNSVSITGVVIPQPPAILAQPQNQTVQSGSNATFTVAAAGSGPLRYQWRRNDLNISGATNAMLSLSPAFVADTGSYSLLISNALGATTSSNALLTVLSPQPVVLNGSLEADLFSIWFNSTPGVHYTLEFSGDPAFSSWSTLTSTTALTTNTIFSEPLLSTQRFYRVFNPQ